MDYRFTAKEEAWWQEVEDFIKAELPDGWVDECLTWPGGYGILPMFEEEYISFCQQFWKKLGKKGWLSMSWPKWNTEKRTHIEQAIFSYIMSYYRAPAGNVATGIGGATIDLFGSDELRNEWLPKIASGDISFWLAYSEPNSGSDLASLQTKAVEDGDDIIINGSKIWSSGAHVSDCAWMVVRTDSNVEKKYQGITFIIVPNDLPGITIRPIVNICDIHSFNEQYKDQMEKGETIEDQIESIAGRVMSIRRSGKKLFFIDIQSNGSNVQVLGNLMFYSNQDNFKPHFEQIQRGDIIGAVGLPHRSKAGELSLLPKLVKVLAPCLRVIPSVRNDLTDKEIRYRQRYLDLICNHRAFVISMWS